MGPLLSVSGVVFAAALFLLFAAPKDVLRVVLAIAAAIGLLLSLRILHLELRGVPLREVLAALLVGLGAVLYFRSSAKTQVAAATCVTLLGALQLLTALHLLR
jgi:hypothetical protein